MFGLPDTYRVNVDVTLKDFIPKALKGRNDKKNVATCHEYLIIYGKLKGKICMSLTAVINELLLKIKEEKLIPLKDWGINCF